MNGRADAQRIGSRWPSFRLPPPAIAADELLASGRTGAGTDYELRFGARRSRLGRAGWAVELLLRRPDEQSLESSGATRGPGNPPAKLWMSLTGSCRAPRESFVTGWAPPGVAAVALLTAEGRVDTRLLDAGDHGSRLVFAAVDGVPRVVALEVVDSDGVTAREEVETPRDPCDGAAEGTFIAWYGGG